LIHCASKGSADLTVK